MPTPLDIQHAIREKAEQLCREHDAKLLFLTLFGSTLYGTETPGKSDVDARGIFLPSVESLALNKSPKSLRYSTGTEETRNNANDLDIDLWSIQHWLLNLLPSGDTGAMDILFSPSHKKCILYKSELLDAIFNNHTKFISTSSGKSYTNYCIGQAKKYGIKGSRVGTLKSIHDFLTSQIHDHEKICKLSTRLHDILNHCGNEKFCSLIHVQDEECLYVCGKTHTGGIRIAEFMTRIEKDMRRYGARAAEAELNNGIDFKALSHAVRSLSQMEELVQTGRITFPLHNRKELLDIKQGKYPWSEIEPLILSRLSAVETMRKAATRDEQFDSAFAEACVLACYRNGQAANTAPSSAPRFQPGFSISDDTLMAILRKLHAAEQQYRVKILYACESGSRGWGFASDDSDFDVRFIYVQEPDWYLAVAPEKRRDVIELGIEMTPCGELDINGWELRKAIKLFQQANPPLLEWLSSPIVYGESGPLASLLRKASHDSISPLRAWHHYRSLMEKIRSRLWEKKPTIKTWFYIMRPLLAMRWIEMKHKFPPMRFDHLVAGTITDTQLRDELATTVALKKQGNETDDFTPPLLAHEFMLNEIGRIDKMAPLISANTVPADLDHIFRAALHHAWPR